MSEGGGVGGGMVFIHSFLPQPRGHERRIEEGTKNSWGQETIKDSCSWGYSAAKQLGPGNNIIQLLNSKNF